MAKQEVRVDGWKRQEWKELLEPCKSSWLAVATSRRALPYHRELTCILPGLSKHQPGSTAVTFASEGQTTVGFVQVLVNQTVIHQFH